jgi:hypothetical protein
VTDNPPTPQEARAALTEASTQAARVRRADLEFRSILLLIAGIYLAAAGIFSVAGRHGGPLPALILAILVLGVLIGIVWLGVRVRAYSRAGFLSYMFAIAAFNIWNAIVAGVSIGTRYWASTEPTYHFGVSAMIGVVPLIVAAWLIGRR